MQILPLCTKEIVRHICRLLLISNRESNSVKLLACQKANHILFDCVPFLFYSLVPDTGQRATEKEKSPNLKRITFRNFILIYDKWMMTISIAYNLKVLCRQKMVPADGCIYDGERVFSVKALHNYGRSLDRGSFVNFNKLRNFGR